MLSRTCLVWAQRKKPPNYHSFKSEISGAIENPCDYGENQADIACPFWLKIIFAKTPSFVFSEWRQVCNGKKLITFMDAAFIKRANYLSVYSIKIYKINVCHF